MKTKIGLLIQAILLIGLIFSGILMICDEEFTVLLQIILMLFMFTTAYNNHTLYKRKYCTEIYLICGIIIGFLILTKVFL